MNLNLIFIKTLTIIQKMFYLYFKNVRKFYKSILKYILNIIIKKFIIKRLL